MSGGRTSGRPVLIVTEPTYSPSFPLRVGDFVCVTNGATLGVFDFQGEPKAFLPRHANATSDSPPATTGFQARLTSRAGVVFAPLVLERWLAPARRGQVIDEGLGFSGQPQSLQDRRWRTDGVKSCLDQPEPPEPPNERHSVVHEQLLDGTVRGEGTDQPVAQFCVPGGIFIGQQGLSAEQAVLGGVPTAHGPALRRPRPGGPLGVGAVGSDSGWTGHESLLLLM